MQTFDTKIWNVERPTGIDAAILQVQKSLAKIPWIEVLFGRVTTQYGMLTDAEIKNRLTPLNTGQRSRLARVEYYPLGRTADSEINLMPSDQFASYGFFAPRDPQTPIDYVDTDPQIVAKQPFSFIFICNLAKIIPGANYLYTEQLKQILLKQLHVCPRFILTNIYEDVDTVLKSYTITETYRQFLKFPRWAIRIDGLLTYPILPENGETPLDINNLLAMGTGIYSTDDGNVPL